MTSSPIVPLPAMTSASRTGWTKNSPWPSNRPSSSTCHHRSNGTVTTRPPSRWMAASFTRGAWSGATIVAATPASRAAHATACPMLPALGVTTPPASASAGACLMAFNAPRILKAPTGCKHSSLSQTSHGASGNWARTSGVRSAPSAITSAARRISSIGIKSRRRCRGRSPARGGRRTRLRRGPRPRRPATRRR